MPFCCFMILSWPLTLAVLADKVEHYLYPLRTMIIYLFRSMDDYLLDEVIHNRRGKLGDADVLSGEDVELFEVILGLLKALLLHQVAESGGIVEQ